MQPLITTTSHSGSPVPVRVASLMMWRPHSNRRFVLLLVAMTVFLVMLYVNRVYFGTCPRHLGNGEDSFVCGYEPDNQRRPEHVSKITIVTGASSREFLDLLNLIDSLGVFEPNTRLVIWDLGLRPCQVRFLCDRLESLKVLLVIKEFRFTFYPLYFRSIKGIWKPVLLKYVVDEYGTALWFDPEQRIRRPLGHIFTAIEQHGTVASCSVRSNTGNSSAYSSSMVGFQKNVGSAYSILMKWYQSTLEITYNKSCRYSLAVLPVNASSCSEETIDWSHFTLNQLMSQSGQAGNCQYLDSNVHVNMSHATLMVERNLQKSFLLVQNRICRRISVCILSGNQSYPIGYPYVESMLRRNKKSYALAHGYHFIEGGTAYTERKNGGNSGPNWGKLDEVLKYLDECETLLFVDTDTVFTNFSIKAESFLDLPEVQGKDMFIVVPSSDQYINAGVLLMRSTDNVRALLLATMDEQRWSTDWRFKFGYEQSALWELLRPVNSSWRNFVHLSTNDHTLQGLCGFIHILLVLYGHCLWQPGDFLAHFAQAPSPSGQIARFMEDYSDLVHVNE